MAPEPGRQSSTPRKLTFTLTKRLNLRDLNLNLRPVFRGGRFAEKSKLLSPIPVNRLFATSRAIGLHNLSSRPRDLRPRRSFRPCQRWLPHLLPRRQYHLLLPQHRQLDHDPRIPQSPGPVDQAHHRALLRRMVGLLSRAIPRRLLPRVPIQPSRRACRSR